MPTKLNIAEILKDCPAGMELDCLLIDGLVFDKVERDGKIRCYTKGDYQSDYTYHPLYFYSDGMYLTNTSAKYVIFPKGRLTWDGFVPPVTFKNGDFVATKDGRWIFIFESTDSEKTLCHVAYDLWNDDISLIRDGWKFSRFATEEEKKKLLKVINGKGYIWDTEEKRLLPAPKMIFKDGDIVATGEGDWIGITAGGDRNEFIPTYCVLTNHDELKVYSGYQEEWLFNRLATEEEKVKLFEKIKEYGYVWNNEEKRMEKLAGPTFKKGDIVRSQWNSSKKGGAMLDLTKVLAGVEPGLKLYCGYINDGKEIGEVTLVCVDPSVAYPIKVQDKDGKFWWFTMTGGYMLNDEECYLSPTDHVSWADFLVEKNSVKHCFECVM